MAQSMPAMKNSEPVVGSGTAFRTNFTKPPSEAVFTLNPRPGWVPALKPVLVIINLSVTSFPAAHPAPVMEPASASVQEYCESTLKPNRLRLCNTRFILLEEVIAERFKAPVTEIRSAAVPAAPVTLAIPKL